MFTPRIKTKSLVELCRRVGTSIEAGIDARRMWSQEAERGSWAQRHHLGQISRAVNSGISISDAMEATDGYFPLPVREMVAVGEEAGRLDEVFLRLADHYQHRLEMRRFFLIGIAPSMIQLAIAVAVVGLFILLMGVIGEITGKTIDVSGIGLVGKRGLVIYSLFVAVVTTALYLATLSIRRGWFWMSPVQRAVLQIPMLGGALRTLALSRMAWSLSMTTATEMDIRRSLVLAQKSTQNSHFIRHIPHVEHDIGRGEKIHSSLRRTGAYPDDFLDTLEVGEESGRTSESMALLSKQYEDRARAALQVLTMIANFVVWGLIALLIIAMIITIFKTVYLDPINDLLRDISMIRRG